MSEKQSFYLKAKEKLTGKFPRVEHLFRNIKNTLTHSNEPEKKLTKLELSSLAVYQLEKYILQGEYDPAFRGGDRRVYEIQASPEFPHARIIEETINILYETFSGRLMSPPRDQEWQDDQFSILRTFFWKIETMTSDEQPTTYYHLFADYPPDHLFNKISPSDLSRGIKDHSESALEEELLKKKVELQTALSPTLKAIHSGQEYDFNAWRNLTQDLSKVNEQLNLIKSHRREEIESLDASELIEEAQQHLTKRETYSDSVPGRSPVQPERLGFEDYNESWRVVGEQINEDDFSSADLEVRKSIQLFNQKNNPPLPQLEHLIKALTPKN